MTQLSIFDTPPPPPKDTRRAAAEAIAPKTARLRRLVLAFVASRGHFGATDEEISVGTELRESTARARRWELREGGQVKDSGQRRKVQSGNQAKVWIATGKPLESTTDHLPPPYPCEGT